MAVMGSSLQAAAASGSTTNVGRRKNRIPTSYAVIFLGIILLAALAAVSFTSTSTKSLLSALSSLDIAKNNQNDETVSPSYTRNILNHAHRYLKTSHKHHKKLLPLDASDKVGFFCATIGLMIAAGGGIGGGGVLVPIYILVMKFSPKHAIPLSNITG